MNSVYQFVVMLLNSCQMFASALIALTMNGDKPLNI